VITTPLRHQLPVDVVKEEEPAPVTSRSGGLRRTTPIRLSLVSHQESGRHDRSTYDTPAKLPRLRRSGTPASWSSRAEPWRAGSAEFVHGGLTATRYRPSPSCGLLMLVPFNRATAR
jgi:hypothetical protein